MLKPRKGCVAIPRNELKLKKQDCFKFTENQLIKE